MITEAQKADRINGIGGSDIPVIAGLLEKWGKTREGLLQVKAGLVPDEGIPEELAHWGNVIEPLVIKRLKTVKGWIVKPSETLALPEKPHFRCNPDGIIKKCEGFKGPGMLEVKNSKFIAKTGPSDYQLAQLMWNIGVARLEWGALAVLVGGCELQVFTYPFDGELFSHLETLAEAFWQDVQTLKRTQGAA